MIRNFALAASFAAFATGASAASIPYGVQTNISAGTVSGWGFSECYSGTYQSAFNGSVNDEILSCSSNLDDHIILAARQTGSDSFALLASANIGFLTSLQSGTGNVTTAHNGAEWYNQDNYSTGFAGLGDSVSRTTCDTNMTNPELRLCWHTKTAGGWRAGVEKKLDKSTEWEKVLLVEIAPIPDVPSVPVPASGLLLTTALGAAFIRRRRAA